MAIRPLRPDQQEVVISTLETATELASQMGPDEALAKSAQQHGLPDALLAYAVNAYNTGRSVANIKSGKTREEKAADVPLADLDGVLRCLHPAAVKKEAVSNEYRLKPALLLDDRTAPVRKAAKYSREPEPLSDDQMLQSVFSFRQETERSRSELNQEFFLYKRAQRDIQNYLDNQNHLRLNDVLEQSCTAFGDMARIVLEPLEDSLAQHKRASWGHIVHIRKEPFTLVKAAIDQLEKVYTMGQECGQKEAELRGAVKSAREQIKTPNVFLDAIDRTLGSPVSPLGQEPVQPVSPANEKAYKSGASLLDSFYKEAAETKQGFFGSLVNDIKAIPKEFGASAKFPTAKPKSPAAAAPSNSANGQQEGKVENKQPAGLLGPDNREEINALHKSVAINNLLASDPDLQGYDRNALTRAFNEIQTAYPRVASHAATLRPFLQRHLTAGGLDEFSLKNLADQEARLQASTTPPAPR